MNMDRERKRAEKIRTGLSKLTLVQRQQLEEIARSSNTVPEDLYPKTLSLGLIKYSGHLKKDVCKVLMGDDTS